MMNDELASAETAIDRRRLHHFSFKLLPVYGKINL
jgi:hypothetical protein